MIKMSRIAIVAIVSLAFICTMSPAASALTPTGQEQLEADWLMQCGKTPITERTALEITWARNLAERLGALKGCKSLKTELATLAKLEKKISGAKGEEAIKKLYFEVRTVKRAIMFSNPLINFDKVIMIDNPYPMGKGGDATNEWKHEARHRNGYMGVPGGRLLVAGLDPDSEAKNLFGDRKGSFWRPDVHFSGDKVIVSFEPAGEKAYHLYEVDKDGKKVTQLTFGDYDDLDPIYTPDGKITFCTSRAHTYVRCMPMTHAYAVARCDANGKNIYVVSRNGEAEYMASVLNDGRVIYTRWEYTEKALWRVQSLWTMNPDGTNVQIFWGNQSRWPDVLTEARAIPGSNRVMFTGLGHHDWFAGCLGIIDPNKGLDYPKGLTKVTPQLAWPEVGDGKPACENETDKNSSPARKYHENGGFLAYKTPYPLSEEDFLCSAVNGQIGHTNQFSARSPKFSLYLMDVYGNRELIRKGTHNAYYAMPFCKRPTPKAIPDRVDWPKIGSGAKPADGILYSNDVFSNAPKILREKGKYIRVLQMDPKNYTTWHKTVQHDGPAISVFQADGVKRILGTVPIEKDGSIAMKVPPGQSLFFQMLDEKKQAIHVMRSFTGVMPGEVRGCFGCHESKLVTRGNPTATSTSIAMKKGPKKPVEPSWGYNTSISYARFVQPVLDKHCAKCHNDAKHKAYAKLNMTLRPSKHRWRDHSTQTRPGDVSPFTEPYLTLVGGKCQWGRNKSKVKPLSGVYVVESYDGNRGDGSDLKTLAPYTSFSPKSKLIENATSGKHGNKVKVTGEDLERLVAWVDANGPYLGDEEIREMYDPYTPTVISIPQVRPRVATAPVINRFDIRQDGNSEKVAGVPLKLTKEAQAAKAKDLELMKKTKKVTPAEIQAAMNEKNVKLVITKASYGSKDQRADVTDQVARWAQNCRYIPLLRYRDLTSKDPARGKVKTLTIEYTLNGKPGKMTYPDNATVVLPKN
ncbi:MAG: hypothetical protein HN350_03055 [Phycisphaerales bacterium]|jgi:hypothetical protein|nr:hypothetical protein [Phycisphaerales bacterium]